MNQLSKKPKEMPMVIKGRLTKNKEKRMRKKKIRPKQRRSGEKFKKN